MRKCFNFGFLSILFYLSFACSNKSDLNSPEGSGQLYFHFHTNIDNIEVPGLDSIINSSTGRKISLSFTKMYISNIKLIKLDGSLYSVSDKVLLKTFWNELYLVGNVPAGNYKSVQFTVGFDSITSAKTPISADTVFNHPEMWFWNTAQPQGYVFLNVQGEIDTTKNSNGLINQMMPFSYRIGTSVNAAFVSLPDENFTVSPNQTQYVHMIINYMKLFDGVDLSKASNLSVQSISDNSNTAAKQIAVNMSNMFSYEF